MLDKKSANYYFDLLLAEIDKNMALMTNRISFIFVL
jgi:hypothetical protein